MGQASEATAADEVVSTPVDSAEACDGPGSTPVFHASQTGTAAMATNAATTSNLSLTVPPPGGPRPPHVS